MICGDSDMGGTATDHAENRCEHAAHASNLLAIGIAGGRKGVVVPEQLIRAVDEVDFQGALRERLGPFSQIQARSSRIGTSAAGTSDRTLRHFCSKADLK